MSLCYYYVVIIIVVIVIIIISITVIVIVIVIVIIITVPLWACPGIAQSSVTSANSKASHAAVLLHANSCVALTLIYVVLEHVRLHPATFVLVPCLVALSLFAMPRPARSSPRGAAARHLLTDIAPECPQDLQSRDSIAVGEARLLREEPALGPPARRSNSGHSKPARPAKIPPELVSRISRSLNLGHSGAGLPRARAGPSRRPL